MVKLERGLTTLKPEIKECTVCLLKMVRDHCWNIIPNQVVYVLSEIEDREGGWKQMILAKKSKDILPIMNFDTLIKKLEFVYQDLHDIHLYVHRVERHRTIISVEYFLKSKVSYVMKKEVPPMLHAKVSLPPYRGEESEKFDVHWEFGGLRHQWKMFWWRQKHLRKRRRPKN